SKRRLAPPLPDGFTADWQTGVCWTCTEGGNLLICEGGCGRAVHPACLQGRATSCAPGEGWKCPDCFAEPHPCTMCHRAAPDSELPRCSWEGCGRRYHLDCLRTPKFRTLVVQWSPDGKSFVCPVHSCARCMSSGPGVNVQCMRCCKAYHVPCMDLP